MSDLFQLSLPGFDGPVEALVPLVAASRLSLGDLPLAEIPAQFLAATSSGPSMDLVQAGQVAATTARLMLLKSAQLLAEPVVEEIDEERVLRGIPAAGARLQAAALDLRLSQGYLTYTSPGRSGNIQRPPEPRPAALLRRALEDMRDREGRTGARAVVPAFVRLETVVGRLVGRLKRGTRVSLGHVLRGARRRDAVMHFLAALELVRQEHAVAIQETLFGDITLQRAEDASGRARRAG